MSNEALGRSMSGGAYGRPPAQYDPLLIDVAQGTPTGEYLRRYWHPIAGSNEVTTNPQKVRVLGEDLILFRDKGGRVGLLYERCMHRGTSLYYERVEDCGIRCCYHGWLFDTAGNCLEQPCEPENGRNREVARQPWYPLEERYGLVFAYMGPLDRKPVLPRYDNLEDLASDEFIETETTGFGGYVAPVAEPAVPYHWLQAWENVIDPFHVQVLHTAFSGTQFKAEFLQMPKVEWTAIDGGVIYNAYRSLPDGRLLDRCNYAILPNIAATPKTDLTPGRSQVITWHVPIDDKTMRVISAARVRQKGYFTEYTQHNGKLWTELTEEERQRYPGDFEAQFGQGRINLHSDEHLVNSDRGIALLRRMMKQQIKIVREGGDPVNVAFAEKDATIKIVSGNFFSASAAE